MRPWLSLLLFGTLLNAITMTKNYRSNNRSRNIGGFVVSIYTVLLCTLALLLIVSKKTTIMNKYKYVVRMSVFLVYLAVLLYTAYQDRDEYMYKSSYNENAPIFGHHAGVFMFSGIFIILLEYVISSSRKRHMSKVSNK